MLSNRGSWTEGYVYFVDAEKNALPAMLVKGGASVSAVFRAAPKPKEPAAKLNPTGKGKASPPVQPPPPEPAQTAAPTPSPKFSIENLSKSLQAVQ